ncbi:conserved hypothetical protein [Pseudomonas phage D3]|uniref:Uncharacterized protein n=1 Tax=Pseudomonas phage D3 TaxID=2932880 RepID=Q9MC58_BPD3|nr:hypothetical protein D3p069 [Pseudomonas phage D3]AAF80823.1 conserved hypothetical protein [Pseudomonas phage D3]
MTTPIVQSISDEQLAELDELTAKLMGDWWVDWDGSYTVTVSPSNIQSLIVRLRAAEADAKRWREQFDCMQLQRDHHRDRADAALAKLAELEKQEPVAYVLFRDGEVYYETDDNIVISNTPGDETDLYRWLPVFTAPVAQAQQLRDLDKQCRDDVARALGLRPNEERGFAWSYLLASIKSCVKASEDIAQAQHSVPEGWMLVECGIWTQEQVDEMQKTVARFRNSEFVDDRALAMAVADAGQCKAPEISLAELLAAAPGKEGV